jgi:DNA-binding CsgD family transcriptional regulator
MSLNDHVPAPVGGDGLVGRDDELGVIRAALDEIAAGGSTFVVIGDAGVGKTALLAAATAEAAARGLCVLTAVGSEAEHHLPFAALGQLVQPILDRATDLPPGHRAALLAALGLAGKEGTPEQLFIALAVLELVGDVSARTPVVLAVDDLQWVDTPSRDVIDFVARRLDAEPTVMLLASRTGRTNPASYPAAVSISLAGLSSESSHVLLRRHAPDLAPADAAQVLSIADGNPLALLELPVSLGPSGSGSGPLRRAAGSVPLTSELERAFADRVDELDPSVRALLLVAALQGSDQISETLAATGELLGRPTTASAFDAAVAAGLVSIEGTAFRFRHPLVRSAIAQRSSDAARIAAHQALAEASAGEPERVAWHRAMASRHADGAVAAALEDGADRVLARGAPVLAQEWLERSAELSDEDRQKAHRLLRAAGLAFELGRASSVRRLMAHARMLPLDPPDGALLSALEGAFDDGVPGDVDHVRGLIAAAAGVQRAGDEGLAAHLLIGASMTCYWGAADEPLLAMVRDAASTLTLDEADPRRIAVRALIDPYRDGAAVVDQLARWMDRETHDPAVAATLGRAGFVVGDFDRSLVFARRASDAFRQQGRVALLAQTLILETFAALYLGRWDVTHVASAEAYRFALETEQPVWTACAQLGQANLAALHGDRAGAEDLASTVEQVAVSAGNRALLNGIQLVRGLAAMGVGAPDEAMAAFARMMDPSDVAYQIPQAVWALDQFADAAAQAGHAEQARLVLERIGGLAAATTAPGVLRSIALARVILADDDEAEARFVGARDLAAPAPPWYRGRLDLAHGSWLRRRRQISEARDALRSAQAVFDALGAVAWAARAEHELRAAGERPHHSDRDAWARLSAQDLQIAQLAAQGLSNREIGERLYLSHRTIGSHLYRIFPSLGVRTRAQLRDALAAAS